MVFALFILYSLGSCGGGGADKGSHTDVVKTLGWITSKDGRLVDEYGRQWLFRGINARVQGLFDGSGEWAVAPAVYEAWDAQRMADLGFNLFRLPINWSGLEPIEGEFSQPYLALLDEIVSLARDAGLYVLIDFHQDKYSRFIGDDGAPRWAIYPALLENGAEDEDLFRIWLAYLCFFSNVNGIQDRFLPAWQLVVSRYADQPNIVGFEVMNEPFTSFIPHGLDSLYSFYEKVAAEMRRVDNRHILWLGPDVYRNKFLWAPLRSEPFPDDNMVYTPHMYPNFEGMHYETADEWVEALTCTFDHLVMESDSWGAAPVIGEWGTHPYDTFAPPLFEAIQQLADRRIIGLAFWLWKEKASGHWGLFDYDGLTDTWTERMGQGMDALIRPGVMAVPGRLLWQSFDVKSKTLTIHFEALGGEGPPLVYIPQRHYPGGAVIEQDGVEVGELVNLKNQRYLVPWNGQGGVHILIVRPRPPMAVGEG